MPWPTKQFSSVPVLRSCLVHVKLIFRSASLTRLEKIKFKILDIPINEAEFSYLMKIISRMFITVIMMVYR